MKKVFDIFRIKGEEKWSAIIALFVSIVLNALTIIKYNNQFSQLSENYHKLFVKAFHVAGFDPLTYAAVSQWNTEYNVYRHPLLAFFMYIPNQINQGLMMLTGYNCVQYIVGAILVFCAFYSFIFLYRIFREVIGTERWDANLLSAFYFSFAYVMVSAMVPDHFIMSMMILLTTLYITGVERRLENLHFLLGKLGPFHSPYQLLCLSGKHRAAHHFYPSGTVCLPC